jgi:hypothetical protein
METKKLPKIGLNFLFSLLSIFFIPLFRENHKNLRFSVSETKIKYEKDSQKDENKVCDLILNELIDFESMDELLRVNSYNTYKQVR